MANLANVARAFLLLSSIITISGLNSVVYIERSEETLTYLGSFAFTSHGHLSINVSHLKIFSPELSSPPDTFLMGVFRALKSNFSAAISSTLSVDKDKCVLTSPLVTPLFSVMSMGSASMNSGERPPYSHQESINDQSGDYVFYFINCAAPSRLVSAKVDIQLYNGATPWVSYSSSGEEGTPWACFGMGVAYWMLAAVWLWWARRAWYQQAGSRPQSFHVTLTILVVFGIPAHFLSGIRFLIMNWNGSSYSALDVIVQINAGVQTLLALITFFLALPKVEPYLSDIERGLLFTAVPGLLTSSLVSSLLEGGVSDTTWQPCVATVRAVFAAISVASFILILGLLLLTLLSWLLSAVWGRKKGRIQTPSRDGSTAVGNPFDSFYIVALSYAVTAVAVGKLIASVMPYELSWLTYLTGELSIWGFYAYVLHRFRPRTEKSVYQLFDESDSLDDELDAL